MSAPDGDTVPAAAEAVAVAVPAPAVAAAKSSFVASRLAALQQASTSPPKTAAAQRPQPNKLQPPAATTAANNTTPMKKPSHGHSASVAQFSMPPEDGSAGAAVKSTAAATASPTQVTPTHVRRNSAPKGAVTSLLSFWRNQDGASSGASAGAAAAEKKAAMQREQAAQDSRIVAQRVSVLLERDAKVQQHAQQLAAASPVKPAKKASAADPAAPVHSPPALSPAPSTLSPSSTRDHDDFEESGTSCGPARDISRAGSSPSQPGPPVLPPPTTLAPVLSSPAQVEHEDLHGRPEQGARVMSDPLPAAHAHDAAAPQPFVLPSPETFTPQPHADHTPAAVVLPTPLPLVQQGFGSMPPLTRCITDYDQDGQATDDGGADDAAGLAPQHQQHHPTCTTGTAAPPPLQREITDNIDMCYQGDGENGEGNDTTATFVQQQQPPQPINAFGLPPLKREVTDLGAETNAWSQEDSSAECQPQDRQQQQQSYMSGAPSHAPPPLSRLETDPVQQYQQGEGHIISGVSMTEEIARDTSIDSSGGSRRSTAAGDNSASLYPPHHRQGSNAPNVSNSNAVLLTRLATDVGAQQSQPTSQPHDSSCASVHALAPPSLLQRAHTEFNLHESEAEAHADAQAAQSSAAAATGAHPPHAAHPMGPPMLTRVQTELNVASYGGASDDDDDADSAARQHQASGNLTVGLPLISRLATEGNLEPHLHPSAHAGSSSSAAPAPAPAGLGPGFKLSRQTTVVRATDSDADTEVADDEPVPDAASVGEAADTVQDLPPSDATAAADAAAPPQKLTLVISHSSESSSSGPASMSAASSSSSIATPSALAVDCATPGSASGAGFGFGLVQPVSPLTPLAVVQALVAPPPVAAAAGETTESASADASAAASAAAAPTAESLAAAASMRAFRLKVEGELLSTEESYVSSLHTLVSHFIHPLKTAGESLHVSAAQIALIFSNIELLYNFHQIFLADLSKAVKRSQARAAAIERGEQPTPEPVAAAAGSKAAALTVADVILKFADFLRMYTQYLAGYAVSLDTIAGLRSNGKFMSFLQEKRISAGRDSATTGGAVAGGKPTSGLDLMSYLIMPVQRIPRYLLLLKELLRYTPRDHPELDRLQDAYTKVQTIARHVNEQQRHVENMSVLLSIQNSIESSSLGQLGQLMVPSRRLVKSALLPKLEEGLLSASTKLRRVYLFNDILLWCETAATETGSAAAAAAAAPSGSEKFAGFIELDKCTVSEYTAPEKKSSGGSSAKIGFKLVPVAGASKKAKDVLFFCKSAEDQCKWVEEIGALQMGVVVAAEEARRRRMDSRVKNAAGAVAATGGLAAARLSNAAMRHSVGNAADAGLVTPPAAAAPAAATATTTAPAQSATAAPAATTVAANAAPLAASTASSSTSSAPAAASSSSSSSSSSSGGGSAPPPANVLGMVSARLLAAVPLPSKGRYERKYGSAIVVSPRAAAAAAAAQAHAKLMRHAIASAQQQQQPPPTGAGVASLDSMATAMATRNPLRTGVAGGALLGPTGAPLTSFVPSATSASSASSSSAAAQSSVLESPVVALMTPEEWQDAQKLAATLLMRRPRASSF